MPADAGAGPERLLDPVDRLQRAERQHVGAGGVDRAVRVRQHEGLLLGQRPRVALGVVGDVAAGALAAQPLRDVPRVAAGPAGDVLGGPRPVHQRPVEPEPVSDDDATSGDRRAEVADEAPEHLVQLVLVHVVSLPAAAWAGSGPRCCGLTVVYERRPDRAIGGNPYGARWLGEPARGGPGGDARAAGHVEPLHEVVHMDLGGLLADAERLADLPVRAAGGDLDRHLPLPRGQYDDVALGVARVLTAASPIASATAAAGASCGPRAARAGRRSLPACGRGAGRGRPGCRASASVARAAARSRPAAAAPTSRAAVAAAPRRQRHLGHPLQATGRCRAGRRPRRAASERGRGGRPPDRRRRRSPRRTSAEASRQAQTATAQS